jgi:hypothetical protein
MADTYRINCRAVLPGEPVDRQVDLSAHRFAVQLVKVAGCGA